jgi:hypothetical protein
MTRTYIEQNAHQSIVKVLLSSFSEVSSITRTYIEQNAPALRFSRRRVLRDVLSAGAPSTNVDRSLQILGPYLRGSLVAVRVSIRVSLPLLLSQVSFFPIFFLLPTSGIDIM